MYTVKYTNPSSVMGKVWSIQTPAKADVRALVRKAREYPGSYKIASITKTTKARGVEYLDASDF